MTPFFPEMSFNLNEPAAYERAQRQKTLAVLLRIILLSGVALLLVNLYIRAWDIAGALLGMSALCLPAIWLNARGRYELSASLTLAIMFLAANYNLLASGGLQDSGMLAYPLIIVVGSLFFGRRSIPVVSLVSLGTLAAIAHLEIKGYFTPTPSLTNAGFCLTVVVLLISSAALVWVILHNTDNNISHIRKAEMQLLETYDLTLAGWAKALEYRDNETEGHSRRVVALSSRLAREMGCEESEIEHITRGALIHDIGKMAIPDYILSKPGPLDREEKITMEKHTVFAREMLAPIAFLQPASDIAYCHHERWDGRGYPRGLKGKEIPKAARLFAVVDQWDALSTPRRYREAWPRERVIAYIRENSGKRFDPQVVEAFLRIV